MSVDNGTTLICDDIIQQYGVTNNNGILIDCIDKANCLVANYYKGIMPRSSKTGKGGSGPLSRQDGKTYCLDTGNTNEIEIREIIQLNESTESNGQQPYEQNRVYSIDGLAPALKAGNGNTQSLNILIPYKTPQAERVYEIDGKSPTMGVRDGGMGAGTGLYNIKSRIRRLTPTEVCRLQTVPDNYFLFDGGGQIVSDTQIYKMCGNGWTIDVIVYILSHSELFAELFNKHGNNKG